jgi:hypothetical protein
VTAAELSAILARLGVPILGHREADDDFAGLIRVTEAIHVELPQEGGGAMVVKAISDSDFEFYGRRTKVKELVFDLIQAGAVVLH